MFSTRRGSVLSTEGQGRSRLDKIEAAAELAMKIDYEKHLQILLKVREIYMISVACQEGTLPHFCGGAYMMYFRPLNSSWRFSSNLNANNEVEGHDSMQDCRRG